MASRKKTKNGRNSPEYFGMQPSGDNRKILFFALDAILIVIFVLIIVVNHQKNKVSSSTDDLTPGTTTVAAGDDSDGADSVSVAVDSTNLLLISSGEDGYGVTWTFLESFDEDYYELDELKEAIQSEADAFNSEYAEAEGSGTYLTLASCELQTVNDGEQETECVEVSLLFSSVEAFESYYNGYTNPSEEIYLFCGTIADALAEGYVFEELYENGGGGTAYLTEELMLAEGVCAILTNLQMGLEIEDTVLCWDENVTEESGVYYTTAGNQNTIIAAAE